MSPVTASVESLSSNTAFCPVQTCLASISRVHSHNCRNLTKPFTSIPSHVRSVFSFLLSPPPTTPSQARKTSRAPRTRTPKTDPVSRPYTEPRQRPLANLIYPIINVECKRPPPLTPRPDLQRLQPRRQNPIGQLVVVRIPGCEDETLVAGPIEGPSSDVSVAHGHGVVSEELFGLDEQVCNRDASETAGGKECDHSCDDVGLAVLGAVWVGRETFGQGGRGKLPEVVAGEETVLGGSLEANGDRDRVCSLDTQT